MNMSLWSYMSEDIIEFNSVNLLAALDVKHKILYSFDHFS